VKHSIEEELEVRVFCEPRELSDSILANVDHLLNACVFEKAKEFFRSFLGESDSEDCGVHVQSPALYGRWVHSKCELLRLQRVGFFQGFSAQLRKQRILGYRVETG